MEFRLLERTAGNEAAVARRSAWPRRIVVGTLGTAGAGIAMAALAAAAFANAPNPVTAGATASDPDANNHVSVTVSGQWSWEAPYSPSPQTNCDGRYGAGWAVDWWGINQTPKAINGLSYKVAATNPDGSIATQNGQPYLTTSTAASPGVTLTAKSGTTFHASQTINGWVTPLCTNGHPAGSFSSTAVYPSAADVPAKICVNFYDLHGAPGAPKLNDFFSTNGDNSIKTNAFDPATVGGNCFVVVPQHPSITVVKTNNAGGGAFAKTNTASSLGENVTFKVEVQNTSTVDITVDSLSDAIPTGGANASITCKDVSNGINLVGETIAAKSSRTCAFTVPNYLATYLQGNNTSVENSVTVVGESSNGNSTGPVHSESTVNAPTKASLGANIRLCQGGTLVSGGNLVKTAGPSAIGSGQQIPATSVDAGDYTIAATPPTGYVFVDCGADYHSETSLSAHLNPGDSKTLNFYVAPAGSPNINYAKTGPAAGTAGQQNDFAYTITLTNTGSAKANSPINFVDVLPAGESFVSASGNNMTCSARTGNPQIVDCTYSHDLAVNASASVDITVRYAAGTEGDTLRDCTGGTVNTANVCFPTKIREPKLTITKTGPDEGTPGGNGSYTITVTNTGDGPATAVSFVDNLPAHESFLSASGDFNCHSVSATQVSCTAKNGVLPLGAGKSLSVNVVVTYALTATNGEKLTDCAVLPNLDQDCKTTTIKTPDLVILKTGPATGTAGGNGTYTITVKNNGQAAANNVTFTDTLPVGESFVSASSATISCAPASVGSQVVNCSLLAPLNPGASVSVQVTVSYAADTGGKTLTDCAALSPTNQSCVPTKIPGTPALTVVKTNDANGDGLFHDSETAKTEGDAVTFQVVVTNNSNVAVVIDSVSDAYDAVTVAECPQLLGAILDPGDSLTCRFTIAGYAPAAGTSLLDTVTVNGHEEGNPGNTTTGADTSTVLTRQPQTPGPDLAIVKTADQTAVRVGETLVYALEVSNVGDGPTTGAITVTDSVPDGLDLVSVNGGSLWDCSISGARDITCTYLGGAVQPGDTLPQITIVTTANTAGVPRVVNTGVVSTPGDVNPTNDRSTVKTPVSNVLGEKIPNTNPPTPTTVLPFTGDRTGALLPVGLMTVLFGLALLRIGRRRRHA